MKWLRWKFAVFFYQDIPTQRRTLERVRDRIGERIYLPTSVQPRFATAKVLVRRRYPHTYLPRMTTLTPTATPIFPWTDIVLGRNGRMLCR